MATLDKPFDPNAKQSAGQFDPVPEAEYIAQIIRDEMGPTKSGSGTLLKLWWEIMDPEQYKGRLVWQQLNIVNQNPQAQAIAGRELQNVCKACGWDKLLVDTSVLHMVPCLLRVIIEESLDFPPKNIVKSVKPATRPPAGPVDDAPWKSSKPAAAEADKGLSGMTVPADAAPARPWARRK